VPGWLIWALVGLLVWVLVSLPVTLYLRRMFRLSKRGDSPAEAEAAPAVGAQSTPVFVGNSRPAPRRILIVDDDAGLRMLLRTTLDADHFEVAEAEDAQRASELARFWRPTVVLLDVAMPGIDGLSFSGELKRKPVYGAPVVILLTGTELTKDDAKRAGADALLRKPFSPLELVTVIDRTTGTDPVELTSLPGETDSEQLLLYARDLGRLVEIERMQRKVVQDAYRETVIALANALEVKDMPTRVHSARVRDYAVQLTAAVEPSLLADPSLEYGFLLHDVGKLAVPQEVLAKPGALTPDELELIREHTVIGVNILADVTFLRGEGIKVIRSHHERWDGTGYPDHLAGAAIPLSARIFAVADAVDAMTGERPYRKPASWDMATNEIVSQRGRQFDPNVVDGFMKANEALRRVYDVTGKAA
jgi:response regulator RpfG family c-di-GMP phosphodiesterase